MGSVLVAVIAASIVIGGCCIYRTILKKEKRKRMNHLLHRFSELGSVYNLTFSSQEILHNCIIGLDGLNRKILVTKSSEEVITHTELIDLSEIKSCSVIKHYGNIKGGELRAKKLETYLELIALHFERNNNQPSIEIPFYQYRKNSIPEIERLEKKAKHWEMLLSKMIPVPVKKIA
ncbi:MAG TPA: hypothetical protein VGN63_06755 [Flavisolibacter sp.]|jgi:hypothetical protein|nr:hypothetical protein [Flavisolibacter sp.]